MIHEDDHDYMHEHDIPHTHEDGHAHEHTHIHAHEHTHEDGTVHTHAHEHTHSHPHTHEGDHAHTHGHAHPQACPGAANCGSNCEGCPSDPKAELLALMQYMVNHNAAHANELAQLAGRLKDEMGDAMAYEQVMQAVSDFEKGNMRLSTVLAALK